MRIDNLRLRTKALIPLLVMMATIALMIVFGASRLNAISVAANEIIQNRDRAALQMARAGRRMLFLPYDTLGANAYDEASVQGKLIVADFDKVDGDTDALLDEVKALVPGKAHDIESLRARFDALVKQAQEPFQLGKATPGMVHGADLKPQDLAMMGRASELVADVDLKTREIVADVKRFNDKLIAENAAAAMALHEESRRAVWTLSLGGLIATLAAGAVSLWLTTAKIAGPISAMVGAMGRLARGDLKVEIDGRGRRDEIGAMAEALQAFKTAAVEKVEADHQAAQLRAEADAERDRAAAERARVAAEQTAAINALAQGLESVAGGDLTAELGSGFTEAFVRIRNDFNQAIGRLRKTVGTVVESAAAIHSGTQEISTASDSLSQRTEQQAASLEETVAALGEITANIRRSAEGARAASQAAAAADADAKNGAQVVRNAVEAMAAISKSATEIEQIIGVIDEIAFQTNLLALNAGVEAARAGEAGRGFAVVASEVRALAQRSAEAAKEIKALISTSTAQVGNGVKLVAESGAALDRIIAQVTGINRAVADIASGAQEQANGLAEIDQAVRQMDTATQQNASMAEESTAASRTLAAETDKLSGLVAEFKLGDVGREAPPAATPLRPVAKPSIPIPPAPRARPAFVASAAKKAVGASANWTEF